MDYPDFPDEISILDTENPIQFFIEEVDFVLSNETSVLDWIKEVIVYHKKELKLLNFIFCSDAYLHQINVEYLQHDTFTDIITFPYAEPPIIHSDIYISIDRVKENAALFGNKFATELHRVIIHGVLHLCGFGDKSETEKKEMRRREEEALAFLYNIQGEGTPKSS